MSPILLAVEDGAVSDAIFKYVAGGEAVAIIALAKALLNSYKERHKEDRETIETLAAQRVENTKALRDVAEALK